MGLRERGGRRGGGGGGSLFGSKSTGFGCDTFRNTPYEFSKHIKGCLKKLPREIKSYSWVSLCSHQLLTRILKQQEASWPSASRLPGEGQMKYSLLTLPELAFLCSYALEQ